ncbi:MAG TPA: mucoidy inhibitor MuiA family protein, partial [Flavobacteriales bacterium]|nr:mucoidy inhibitor MuiA family protein [Flavobacteriales bacterium]
AGEQQLLFTDLPQRLNPTTIRLGASEFVQIVSINHRLDYITSNEDSNPEIRSVKDSMEFYVDQVKLKQGVYNSLASTKQMILANKVVKGETHGMEAEDVTDLLDFYRDKLNEINTKSLALEKLLEVLGERKNKFTSEYNKLVSGKAKTFSELLVTVRAKHAGKANFTIDFYTPDAGWNPLYDIRNNGSSGQLEITSSATMWQKTGYEWKNVDITLSTLNPQFNINAPVVGPQALELGVSYYQRQNQTQQYDMWRQQSIMADSLIVPQGRNVDGSIIFSSPRNSDPQFTQYWKSDFDNQTNNVSNGPGTEYKIATPYTIPSNAKDTRIEINRKMVTATFKYKTVPKVEKAVFLMALITGWDTLNYYPGTANVFNNGTYVGNVFLNTQTVQDSLELSLGQDKSFSVEYETVSEKTFTQNSGSSVKRGKGYLIKIMNKKDVPVTLEILDQAPLTTTQEVSITIDKGEGVLDPMTGFVTWRKTLPPGQKTEVPISYTVKYPKEHYLYNF